MYLNTYTNVVPDNLKQCLYIKQTTAQFFDWKKNFIDKFKPTLNNIYFTHKQTETNRRIYVFLFVCRNRWGLSDQPYNRGRHPWRRRWLMKPICVRKSSNGNGWCGSVLSKFPVQLSCCGFSGFTDFRSTFDNFMPLVSVLHQIFQAIRSDIEIFHVALLCVFEVRFLASLRAFSLRQFGVEQFLW